MSVVAEINQPVLVVGCGPVGQMLAAHLAAIGLKVAIADPAWHAHLAENGIRIAGVRDMEVPVWRAYPTVTEIDFEPSVILVAVKTPVLRQVATEILECIGAHVPIVIAQNGLDPERIAREQLPDHRVARMVINYAGSWTPDERITYAWFRPPNYIGTPYPEPPPWIERLAAAFTEGGLETVATGEIRKASWEKVLKNAALSGLCAVTNQTMEEAMGHPETLALFTSLLEEGIADAGAEGIELDPDFKRIATEYCSGGGAHRPSALVDLRAGMATEIDECNGRIAQVGRALGLAMPHHQTVSILVHTAEARRQAEIREEQSQSRAVRLEENILRAMPDVEQVVIVNRPGETLGALVFPHVEPENLDRDDCSKHLDTCTMRCAECTIGESFANQLRELRSHLGPHGEELQYFMIVPGENPVQRGDLSRPFGVMRSMLAERFSEQIDAVSDPESAPYDLARLVVRLDS